MNRYDDASRLSTPNMRRRVARSGADKQAEAQSWDWAEHHRGRAAISPPPIAARAVGKVIRPLSKRFGPGVHELDAHWPAIIGEALAKYTRPERLHGAILTIRARGPAAALAEAQAPQILERVARYAGKSPKRLKIVQGPLAQTDPAPQKRSRIHKVKAFSLEPKGLNAVMAEFEAAVRQREAGLSPNRPARSADRTDPKE